MKDADLENTIAEVTRTILTVDDHELVRVGLRSMITQRFGGRFSVAESQSLEQALLYLKDHVDEVFLLLLDLHLSDTRGLIGLQLLKQRYPRLPIIVVSGMHDSRVREEALGHGAIAYFNKTGDRGGLNGFLEMVEKIADGNLRQPDIASFAELTASAAYTAKANLTAQNADMKLSSRQVQVLELILTGHDNLSIAHETGLALGSVKNCVSSIFLIFNVRSRAELIGLFVS